MSLFERLRALIRPQHHTRRAPTPPVAVDIGPAIPAWLLRVLVFVLTLITGIFVVTAPGQLVLFAVIALLVAVISEAAIGLLVTFLVAAFHFLGEGIAPGWQAAAVVALVHLILVITMISNEIPAITRVQLHVLRRPLLSWGVIQLGVQVVALFAWMLQTQSVPGPWVSLLAGVGLCAVTLVLLFWFRKDPKSREPVRNDESAD